MDLGIVFEWVNQKNRATRGFKAIFSPRGHSEYILCLKNHSLHTRCCDFECPKIIAHNPPSHTRKVKKSLAEIQHRHKWSKSHAALGDSYKTQIIIPRCQKQSDRLHFVSQHNQFFHYYFFSAEFQVAFFRVSVNTSRIKSVSERKFTMVDMKKDT